MRRVRLALRVLCVVCLLVTGILFGQAYFGSSSGQVPPMAAAAREKGLEKSHVGVEGSTTGVEGARERIAEKATESSSMAPPDRLGLALASVGDQLVQLWEQVVHEELSGDPSGAEAVLAEVALWGGAARVRTTYEMVDLDRLKERIATRDTEPEERILGLSGELTIADVGSVRVGYRMRPGAEHDGSVGVADAEVEYRLGKRATVAADMMWSVGAEFNRAAGLNLAYEIAPNTSLKAGYHLLNFGDAARREEQHSAAASLQLRF